MSKHGVSFPRCVVHPRDRILTANSEKEHHAARHYRSHLHAKRGKRSHGGGPDVPSRYSPSTSRCSSERMSPFSSTPYRKKSPQQTGSKTQSLPAVAPTYELSDTSSNGELTQPPEENTWTSSSPIAKSFSRIKRHTKIALGRSAIWLVCWRTGHGGRIVTPIQKQWLLSGMRLYLLR